MSFKYTLPVPLNVNVPSDTVLPAFANWSMVTKWSPLASVTLYVTPCERLTNFPFTVVLNAGTSTDTVIGPLIPVAVQVPQLCGYVVIELNVYWEFPPYPSPV